MPEISCDSKQMKCECNHRCVLDSSGAKMATLRCPFHVAYHKMIKTGKEIDHSRDRYTITCHDSGCGHHCKLSYNLGQYIWFPYPESKYLRCPYHERGKRFKQTGS